MTLAPTTTAYDETLAYLFSRIDYERANVMPYGARDFKLDRMRELLARLGDPHLALPIVHVAGTKGKGSTAAMIAAVLSAAGLRTGLFSSPHLDRLEERVRVDGQCSTADDVVALVRRIRPVAAELDAEFAQGRGPGGPTYFEVTTAMALLHFVEQKVDAAVLEVGLGGRLDSTNVCQPRVSVITSISFDHTRQLGNTLASIAWEKAGIVKTGVPVVSGVMDEEPRRVIEDVCAERQSPLVELGRDFDFTYRVPRAVDHDAARGQLDFAYRLPGHEQDLKNIELALLGRHQAANAAVALATLTELKRQGWAIPEQAIRRGLADVAWPARVEVVGRQPTVILDAAHNVASIEALLATHDESFSARRRLLVFATTRDKDARGMLRLLLPKFDTIILTRYLHNPRNLPPEELRAMAGELSEEDRTSSVQHGKECLVSPDPRSAWQLARQLAEASDLICITGSFFLAGEMRQEMLRAV